MRKFAFIISFSFITAYSSFSQCQPVNGSFENWVDYTDSIEKELQLKLSQPVFFPQGWVSLVRLLEIALSGFIVEYLDKDTLDVPIYESLKQYSPGANGTASAARISGDTLVTISDLIQLGHCGGRPGMLTGYVKYEGSSLDTINIIAILHNSDLIDTADAVGYAFYQLVGGSGDISRSADYVPFQADFRYRSEEVADSFSLLIVTSKDSSNLLDTSYYVVDEIRFEGGSVAVNDSRISQSDLLLPNPTGGQVRLNMAGNAPVEMELFDVNGQILLKRVQWHGDHLDLSGLPAGLYMARLRQENNGTSYWQKLVKY